MRLRGRLANFMILAANERLTLDIAREHIDGFSQSQELVDIDSFSLFI